MSDIRNAIEALGYSNSKSLFYADTVGVKNNRQIFKLFDELGAAAIYTVNGNPFILFLEAADKNISDQLVRKIWNAQIPLAMICFENRIEVYNGCSIDRNNDLIPLTELDPASMGLTSDFSFWRIADPAFWQGFEHEMSAPKLDALMLENIREATQLLRGKPCAHFAVKIILRLIFIRYLIDRGVDLAYHGFNGNVTESQSCLLEIMNNKTELYDFFKYLKKQFNGNLFDLHENEADLLDHSSMSVLRDLMAGDLVLSSGQTSLFPMYDFNIIPVELISNIYERFIGDDAQQQDKAFYTPPYLVSYLLEQTIVPFLKKNSECTILDPACGSGIFLVESARRLIENRIAMMPDDFDDQALVSTITKNLWGVDKNPEAIDVAIFSIYITILDYKDPKTLKDFTLPLLENKNLFSCDFFSTDADKHLEGKNFDFIVGNPPWGNVDGSHVTYCKERNYPIHRKEISRSFILRTKAFSTKGTCCCMIVTSKLFYNKQGPAEAFRKWLLRNTIIRRYVELAPVRELIFTGAQGPAGVVIYQFNEAIEENMSNEICHLTLKPNVFFKLFHVIAIEKNDYKYMQQKVLLDNDWVWKLLIFGSAHDYRIIKSLKNRYPTINHFIETHGFQSGIGLTTADGEKQDKQSTSHLKDQWLIDARSGIKSFEVILENGKKFDKQYIHRAKEDKQYLFHAPYALVKKGFDIKSFKFRAAYSEEDFLYTDAITGICGKEKDSEVLLSLTGLINSSFYAYLNLMLGSSAGIEREQGFQTEIFEYPAVTDGGIASLTRSIIDAIKEEKSVLSSLSGSSELIRKLDDLVLDICGLSCDVFVDYALNIQIQLVAENKVYWEKVKMHQLREYAGVFIDYFSSVLPRNAKYISANIYQSVAGHYCAVEISFSDIKPTEVIVERDCSKDAKMDWESMFMVSKMNDLFYQIRDVIEFSENSFYIIKHDEYRKWHPAMAKLDLSDILDSILKRSEETYG